MPTRDEQHPAPPESQPFDLRLSGPNLDEPRPLIGPDRLMDRARAAAAREDDRNREAVALGKRLVIAFVLMVGLSVGFVVLVAELNVYVPPIVFLLSFIAIAVGTVLTVLPGAEVRSRQRGSSCGCADAEGRPIGCCQGPRPLRMFRDRG
ncbi:MAG: hypothetical protein ACIARR_09050 [Phycisphaerales bacterium JB059]